MIPSKEPTFTIEKIDNDSNYRRFYVDGEANNMVYLKFTDKTISVSLKLASETHRREIGLITKSTKTFFMKRERKKHLFLKNNAYGFAYYILRYQNTFDYISLSDEYSHWKIPVAFILKEGNILEFKNNGGFEKQIFVTLEQIEKFKINESENRRM